MAITLDPSAGISATTTPDALGTTEPIPANPLLTAFGENPWDVEEAAYEKSLGEWQQKTRDTLDGIALDPDSYFKDKDLGPDPDTERTKMHTINAASLEFLLDRPIPDDPTSLQRKLALQEASIRFYGGRAKDEGSLLGEIRAEAQGRRDRRDLGKDLLGAASLKAFQAKAEEGAEQQRSTFREWKEAAKARPGYDPTQEADYFEVWHGMQAAVKEQVDPFRPSLDAVWNAFTAKGDVRGETMKAYGELDPAERGQFMAALALRAKSMPEKDQATFWGNLTKQTGRDTKGFLQAADDYFVQLAAPVTMASTPGNLPENKLTMDTAGAMEDRRKAVDFAADVVAIQQADYDPMKYLAADGSWSQVFEKGAYGAPGAVVTSAVAAVPVVGMAAFYGSSRESIYQQYRQDFQGKGMSYDEAASMASGLAPLAAVPQVLLERLQLKAVSGKLPVLDKVLNGMLDKVSSRVARFGLRTGILAAEEGSLEKIQDLVPAMVQDIGHALEADVPDVQWTGKGGALDGYWKDNVQMMVTMLPLAIFGAAGGVSQDARAAAFKNASTTELQALGMTAEGIAAINGANGQASLNAAVDAAWESRDASTPEAAAAVEAMKVQVATTQRAQEDLEKLGYALPSFVQTPQGIFVFDGQSGEELGQAPDMAGALKISRAHTVALDDLDADQVAALGTLMEAAKAATELDPASLVDVAFGETFDPEQASPEMAARFAAQVALKEQAEGGSGDIARSVLGYSQTTMAQGMRETVNKLFRGAAVTDVFHETFHGLRRGAHAAGTITRADEIALLRGLDQVLGGKATKDGTALRFIPDGMMDNQISDTLLDEAIAEIAEMEVLRTRKGQGKGKLGVSRGVVSRNLTALAKLMPGVAGKWVQFFRAIRARWGLSLSRAVAIKKAERDGKFDKEGYEQFLNKLLGLDAQAEHDAGVVSEFDRILGLPDEIEGDDIPFSIGKMGAIGIVDSYGAVQTKALNSEEDLMKLEHAPVFGSAATAGADRFRYARDVGLEWTRPPSPESVEAVTNYLERRGFDPAGGEDVSFSIGPADVAGIMSGDALARITDPRRRTQVMSRIARDYNAMRLSIERMTALSGIRRSKADLRLEANAREDLAAEEKIAEIHAKFGSLLADGDLVKIKAQPVHAYLADPTTPLRGRLMSKAAAIKAHPERYQLHRAGEYDGSDGVSRSVFGGTRMPDQAAQELYDHGLISEPTPDAMWEMLLTEQKTVAGMKELLQKATEEIRSAKQEAKREATEWLQTQAKDQEVNFSDKEEIRRSLRMLDAILLALPPEIRGNLGGYTQISMIATDKAKLAFLKDKLAKADKELEQFLRLEFRKEWDDLIKRAGPKTNNPGERPSGSIAADAWDILNVANQAAGLSFAKGETLADALDAEADHPDTAEKDVDVLRAKAQMVRLTMNWEAADAARREQAVLEAHRIYYGGLQALGIENSRRRERLKALRTSAITGTKKTGARMERKQAEMDAKGSKLGELKQLFWEFLSFGQVVNVLFGEKSNAAKWFNAMEISASNAAHDGFQAKANSLEALMETLAGSRFGGEKLKHKMTTEQTIKVQDALGVAHTFSDAEAITFLLMWRQEDGRRHMECIRDDETQEILSEWAWDDKAAAEIERQLSDNGRAVMAFLGQSYGEEYGRINDVFRRIWNVSMPRHKLYAPLSVKPVQGKADSIVDPVSGDTMGAGMTPGSLKNRSFSAIAEPDFKDAFQVFIVHARQMEHFIAYGEFSRDALGVINRRETINAVQAAGGPYAARVLSKWVDFFALGGIQDAAMGGAWSKVIGGALGRLSQAALVGRVSVLAMQSLQLGAAMFKMPVGAFVSRFVKLTTGRLGWGEAIGSEYIQRRLSEMPPVVRDMMQGLASGTPNRAKYYAGMAGRSISGADALFTSGTYAIFLDYAKSQGMDDAAAHVEAERLTDQVAQPFRPGARSWLEISMQAQPAFRAMWNFSTDPRQKMALVVYEFMRRDKEGKGKVLSASRQMVLMWAVAGVLQTVLRAISRDLRDDDDKELFDERFWDPKRLALSAATGPLGAVPFLGGMIEDATYKATGQFMPRTGLLGALGGAAAIPGKWAAGKVEPLKDAEGIATAGATASGTSAAAASAMHLIRDVVGITDNFTDWGD
jgi:uncharacterized glyoxalase superfamily protein PhnB